MTAALGGRVQIVGDDLFVTNPERLARGIRERCGQRAAGEGQPDRHADRDPRRGRAGPPLRLPLHDEPPLRRDRGHHDRRPRGGDGLRADQDRRAGPVASAWRSTTSSCGSRRSSTTPRGTPAPAPSRGSARTAWADVPSSGRSARRSGARVGPAPAAAARPRPAGAARRARPGAGRQCPLRTAVRRRPVGAAAAGARRVHRAGGGARAGGVRAGAEPGRTRPRQFLAQRGGDRPAAGRADAARRRGCPRWSSSSGSRRPGVRPGAGAGAAHYVLPGGPAVIVVTRGPVDGDAGSACRRDRRGRARAVLVRRAAARRSRSADGAGPRRRPAAGPDGGDAAERPARGRSRVVDRSWAARRGRCVAVAHRCPCGLPDVVRDLAAAGGRHAVPDALLPDLPAGDRGRRPAGVGRADAGDGRTSCATDPELAAGVPGRARGVPGHPGRAGDVLPTRSQRRRHARPGQVPARAGRATRSRPGRASTRSATGRAEMGEWWAAGPCAVGRRRTA